MKVLVVDDHPIVRAGLRRLLATAPETEFCEASSGKQALSVFRDQRPTMIVLDLNLPDIGGLEVIARLRAADPSARVLILSMHDDSIYVTRALQAGAVGYVSKNAPPEEILQAIRRVGNGQTYIERDIAEELVFSNIQTLAQPLEDLSSRELEILRLLARGCTLSQIADAIGVSYKTAANRCTQLKAKLGAATTADLIRLAMQSGLGGPPSPPLPQAGEG